MKLFSKCEVSKTTMSIKIVIKFVNVFFIAAYPVTTLQLSQ